VVRQEQLVGLSAPSSASHGFDSPTGFAKRWSAVFQGLRRDASTGRLLPDFDFHSRLSAQAMHDISSNLAGRRRVCLLHYSQRAIAGHAH
jgi:hypothetical protein